MNYMYALCASMSHILIQLWKCNAVVLSSALLACRRVDNKKMRVHTATKIQYAECRNRKKAMLGLLVCCDSCINLSVYLDGENKKEGCDWQGAWSDMNAHLQECKHYYEPCQYPGCTHQVKRNFNAMHVSTCPHRPSECDLCQVKMLRREMRAHKKNVCPKAIQACPRACGVSTERCLAPTHEETCPNVLVKCKFPDCPAEVKRGQLDEHIRTAMSEHLQIMCNKVETLTKQTADRDLIIKNLNHKISNLERDLAAKK